MEKIYGQEVLRLSDEADFSDTGAGIFFSPPAGYEDLVNRYVLTSFNEGGYNTTCQVEKMLREIAGCEEITTWLASRGVTLQIGRRWRPERKESTIEPELRRTLIWSYSLGFLCSFPFIFLAWALHQTVLFIMPTIFSIGFAAMVIWLLVSGKGKKDGGR